MIKDYETWVLEMLQKSPGLTARSYNYSYDEILFIIKELEKIIDKQSRIIKKLRDRAIQLSTAMAEVRETLYKDTLNKIKEI